MARVCVVGGGTAGIAAAKEAALRGAEVTVLERSGEWEPPSRTWTALISHPTRTGRPPEGPGSTGGVDLRLGVWAKSASPESIVTSKGGRILADSVVIATGAQPVPMAFEGRRKRGVMILDRPEAYAELGDRLGSVSQAVIAGEGREGLRVAEKLMGGGRRVLQFASFWQNPGPSPPVLEVIRDAAARGGTVLSEGRLERALGSTAVEGAVVDGRVVPCDTLVVIPLRRPAPAPAGARLAHTGGLLVDRNLRTSAPGVYAAGMSAHLESANPPRTLHESAESSGMVAGANSSGESLRVGWVGSVGTRVFGLRWLQAGTPPGAAALRNLNATSFGRRTGQDSACTLVYDRRSRVLGVETVEEATSLPSGLAGAISGPVTLAGLAYGWEDSSDISVVSDTARLGLRQWSRY